MDPTLEQDSRSANVTSGARRLRARVVSARPDSAPSPHQRKGRTAVELMEPSAAGAGRVVPLLMRRDHRRHTGAHVFLRPISGACLNVAGKGLATHRVEDSAGPRQRAEREALAIGDRRTCDGRRRQLRRRRHGERSAPASTVAPSLRTPAPSPRCVGLFHRQLRYPQRSVRRTGPPRQASSGVGDRRATIAMPSVAPEWASIQSSPGPTPPVFRAPRMRRRPGSRGARRPDAHRPPRSRPPPKVRGRRCIDFARWSPTR